jgi:hypothetical protein
MAALEATEKVAGNLIFHDGVAESLMYTQTHVQSGRIMLAGPKPLLSCAHHPRRDTPKKRRMH